MTQSAILTAFETRYEEIHKAGFVDPTIENPVSYDEQLLALNVRDQDMILIGTLDAQVCNGGFSQWITNGYSENGEALREALRRTEVPLAGQVDALVRSALGAGEEPNCDDVYERWYSKLEPLDDAYYVIKDAFMEQIAAHFCG